MVAENIMRVFEIPQIRKCKKGNYVGVRDSLVDIIHAHIQYDLPIHVAFSGLPFKSPNIASTPRVSADMGELIMIRQLLKVRETVKLVYTPGCVFEVLSETEDYIQRRVFEVSHEMGDTHTRSLKRLIELVGAEGIIVITKLSDLTAAFPEFQPRMDLAMESRRLDNGYDDALTAAQAIMFRSIGSNRLTLEDSLEEDDDPLRFESFAEEAMSAAMRHGSYHDTKTDLGITTGYLGRRGAFNVAVVDLPDRFSINSSHPAVRYLPPHGVPVLDERRGTFDIVRIRDLLRDKDSYRGIFCEGDDEMTPFYYVKK